MIKFLFNPWPFPSSQKMKYTQEASNVIKRMRISEKQNHPRCSFCGLQSNTETCSAMLEIGVSLSDKDMGKFCSVFNHLHNYKGKIDFDNWSLQNSVPIDGITRQAYHMILNGLFIYQSIGYPYTIVVGVHILYCIG